MAGYGYLDAENAATWEGSADSNRTEIADLCSFYPDAFFKPAGYPFEIQHVWSNTAAAAGHNPCQPRDASEVYFVGMPQGTDSIETSTGVSRGISLRSGTSKTVSVRLTSDAPTGGPWLLSSDVKSPSTCVFDPPQGENGAIVQMTISVTSTKSQVFVMHVISTLGDAHTVWPTLIEVTP